MLLDYQDHYNAKQNKCFIHVEYHFDSHMAGPGGNSWTNDITLYDVYENAKYGEFTESHRIYFEPKPSSGDDVITCEASEDKCKTIDEFNNLVRPYLSD